MLELHELMAFKNVCVMKASAMNQFVADPELKSLLQQDVQASQNHIQQLQNFLSRQNQPQASF
ncbi:MAG: spore coat protein [Bacillota bacterium]|nr:spore coat protein [Bacillota bacterium]